MRNTRILDVAELISKNIENYGLERYDLRDTRYIPFLLVKKPLNIILRKTMLLLEEFVPITIRKILGIEKKCWPTTYTFLGHAYYLAEKNNIKIKVKYNAIKLVDMCLNKYVNTSNQKGWWKDEPHIGMYNASIDVGKKIPTLPMHFLTRCNIMLLTLGKYYSKANYVNIGVKSALLTLKQYQVIDFQDGTKSISYFYNTKDCTININSEFAHWLSLIPLDMHTEQTLDMLHSIIRLLIKEQNPDGSWYYLSKWHMEEYREKPTCDCHHTATVLYNIINILKCDYIDKEIQETLINVLNKGMSYFIYSFFNLESGRAITQLGYKRTAGPVQYSEAVFAFCDFLTTNINVDKSLWLEIKKLLPKVMEQNIKLINQNNGSAPSEKIIKWKNINSIIWGNGPVLQAIMSYLSIYNEVYNNEIIKKE